MEAESQPRVPWFYGFRDLIAYRVREILLVSSPYDAFTLEEDGRLTERLYAEYSELNLSMAPRITHASTGAQAIALLAERRFDLVITMVRLEDVAVMSLGARLKQLYPDLPVVLLAFSEADLENYRRGETALPHPNPSSSIGDPRGGSPIDGVFVWTGNARILLAIIKLVEDAKNVGHDTEAAEVRVIIVVEDSVRRYSSFLTLLYTELMTQSASLIAEGVNEVHKLMRMRARPKILLATTYEEAVDCFERYRDYAFALISDVRFSRGGVDDPSAGFELIRYIRREDPELPILLQSAEPANLLRARDLGVHHADKNSKSLLREIRDFMKESLGFGDFIFRLEDRTEVARARNLAEMEAVLRTLPAASIEYHGARNHFSLWLMARSMFGLARLLKPRTITDFKDIEGVRQHLLTVLRRARSNEREGMITDFSDRLAGSRTGFVRIGKGSVGGKARGIAFIHSMIAREGLLNRFPELEIKTPRTIAISTDEFDRFVDENGLLEPKLRNLDDREVIERFLDARLPNALMRDLEIEWSEIEGPIAVRSSSLLEDAQFQPFAGIYATYMLPNTHPNPHVRFDELCRAVKAVYASTFSKNARAYIEGTTYSLEEEKMGVVIQEMVGRRYQDRFYPHASGVALSYNYYPVGPQRAEDGVVLLALGLGHIVVSGGKVLRFSPRCPGMLPQFPTPAEYLRYSQSQFFALDMKRQTVDFASGAESSLVLAELSAAEADGALRFSGSVYATADDQIRDTLSVAGPRLVTFNNILKWNAIPLPAAIEELLELARRGLGCPVEIEFALDAKDGKDPARLYVLQIRPLATQSTELPSAPDVLDGALVFCRAPRSLGHGVVRDLYDVVYVRQKELEPITAASIAAAVGAVNASLQAERRPYLLIGPGRWGSSDPRLGVPVEWSQIAGAKVIVEIDLSDRAVEPSQGSHFFHNILSRQIGYLTVLGQGEDTFIDLEWLDAQPAERERDGVRHVRLEEPLSVYLDGRKGCATVIGEALRPLEKGASKRQ